MIANPDAPRFLGRRFCSHTCMYGEIPAEQADAVLEMVDSGASVLEVLRRVDEIKRDCAPTGEEG